MGVQARCEDLNLKLVILVGVYTKVLDLIERDRLIFGRRSVGWRVILWICAESANIYLTGGDGTIGVDLEGIRRYVGEILSTAYHDSDEWVLELLVRHLSVDVDTR